LSRGGERSSGEEFVARRLLSRSSWWEEEDTDVRERRSREKASLSLFSYAIREALILGAAVIPRA
jgi:hypothetical protein